jgi:2-hydroxy-3-oxopropionate reductase
MAKHILAKGYKLVVHNRSRGAVDELVQAGAIAADSPAHVAQKAGVVITMVPDTPDVERVLTAPDGVLSALQANAVVIDMSSISPVATRALAAQVAAKGGAMLDAPVSGGEIGAINATLSIMVGGSAQALARVKPILECMGNPERIIHVGEAPGSGQICKVCNQIAIGGALAGVSEAFAIARKAGVDTARVREALLGGFAEPRAGSPRRADDQKQLRARFPDAAVSEGSSLANEVRRARGRRSRDRGRHAARERARRLRRRRSGLLGVGNGAVRAGGADVDQAR